MCPAGSAASGEPASRRIASRVAKSAGVSAPPPDSGLSAGSVTATGPALAASALRMPSRADSSRGSNSAARAAMASASRCATRAACGASSAQAITEAPVAAVSAYGNPPNSDTSSTPGSRSAARASASSAAIGPLSVRMLKLGSTRPSGTTAPEARGAPASRRASTPSARVAVSCMSTCG